MSKKIEELLNMSESDTISEDDEITSVPQVTEEETGLDFAKLQETLDTADKIDQALPAVKDLELLDRDMDEYANKAMEAFKDLMDLGNNVEDRHAAGIFDVAKNMMSNAITAKQSKLDKKLKMIDMQMKKRKLDLEEKKVEMQIAKMKEKDDDFDGIDGEGSLFDRSDLINDIMNKMKENDK